MRKIITKLRDAGLPIDINKSEFHIKEVKYLGLIITYKGIKIDLVKVEAILN